MSINVQKYNFVSTTFQSTIAFVCKTAAASCLQFLSNRESKLSFTYGGKEVPRRKGDRPHHVVLSPPVSDVATAISAFEGARCLTSTISGLILIVEMRGIGKVGVDVPPNHILTFVYKLRLTDFLFCLASFHI